MPAARRLVTGRIGRVVIVGVTVAVALLCARATFANAIARRSPELAVSIQPHHPDALTARGEAMLVAAAQDPAALRGLAQLARGALAVDPLNAAAIRLFTLSDPRRSPDSTLSLLTLADSVSRRDTATQFALIELYVARDDVPAVLQRYDVALRTKPAVYPILFPLLASASATPELFSNVRRIFAEQPTWLTDFVDWALTANVPGDGLASAITALPTVAPSISEAQRGGIVNRLVTLQHYGAAFQLHARWSPNDGRALLRNANFAAVPKFPPLDWQIADRPGLSADFAFDHEQGLRYVLAQGAAGIIVSQLLALPAGAYRLAVQTSLEQTDGGGQRWLVDCIGGTGQGPLNLAATPSAGLRTVEGSFAIPAGCPVQWLRLEVLPWQGDEPASGMVRAIELSSAKRG